MVETVNEMAKIILALSVSGGIFALVLFALKPLVRNKLSKSFQYYIWLVVLLRFILPFSFGVNLVDAIFDAPNAPQVTEETVIPNNNPAIKDNPANNNNPGFTEQQPTTPLSPNNATPFDLPQVIAANLLWIWLTGAVISMAFNILGYLRFIQYIRGVAYAVEIPNCMARVYKSRFVPTPMLVGVVKPRIYLPDTPYTDEQLNNILLHEFTHLRRHDTWLKWFATLVVSVHWFNPVVYFIRREFNRACELSCDEAVIRNLDSTAKQNYGDTLISVVAESRYPVGVMSVTMCEEKKKLKERLVAIMNYKKKTKLAVLITAILAVTLTGCALAFGAGFGAKNSDLIEFEVIYTDITEYSQTIQFKNGDILYSVYIVDNEIQSPSNWSGFKEIGYAADDFGKFRIFEREGYSVDEFIVVQDYGFMNGATIYAAEKSGKIQAANYDISLADLRQLAAKGDELIFEDFSEYEWQDVGSGLFILHFTIEDGYSLLVGGSHWTGKPMYTTLSIPGVEECIDIRYDDLDEFIGKYPVPNELSAQIYGYLDTIMSLPKQSSGTGDYIKAHQTEYDAIVNMGVTALPALKNILDGGDMSLCGNLAWLLAKDIIAEENKSNKPHSEWLDGYLYLVSQSIGSWENGMGYSASEGQTTRNEIAPRPVIDGSILADLTQGEQIISVAKLSAYRFYTNSEQITVSIPSGEYSGTFYLYDAENPSSSIMGFALDQDNRTKTFTNLTSANEYYLSASGIDDSVLVTVSD